MIQLGHFSYRHSLTGTLLPFAPTTLHLDTMITPRNAWVLFLAAHVATAAPVDSPPAAGAVVDLKTVHFVPGQFVTLVPAPSLLAAPVAAPAVPPTPETIGTGKGSDDGQKGQNEGENSGTNDPDETGDPDEASPAQLRTSSA